MASSEEIQLHLWRFLVSQMSCQAFFSFLVSFSFYSTEIFKQHITVYPKRSQNFWSSKILGLKLCLMMASTYIFSMIMGIFLLNTYIPFYYSLSSFDIYLFPSVEQNSPIIAKILYSI